MAQSTTGFVVPELNAEGIPIPFALDNWIDAFHAANQDHISNSGRLWDQNLQQIAVGGMTISIVTRDAHRKPLMEFDEFMDRSSLKGYQDVQGEVTRCVTGIERGRQVTLFKSITSSILMPRLVAPDIRYTASLWMQSYKGSKMLADKRPLAGITRNSKHLQSAEGMISRVVAATAA